MKCRCGHGRTFHRRMSGHKNLPCQAVILDPVTHRGLHGCTCRNFTLEG